MRPQGNIGPEPAGIKTTIVTKPARPQQKTDRPSPLASVVAHPLFPVIAAVWFAALFGMGALAASGDALASLVGHLHISMILAAAAPPLGTTAHVLIAIGLAGLGAASGLVLGLVLHARAAGVSLFDLPRINAGIVRARAARPAPKPHETAEDFAADDPTTPAPRVRNRDAHPDAPPRRPLVVTEDVLPYHAPVTTIELVHEPVANGDPVSTAQDNGPDFGEGLRYDHSDAPFGAFMTAHSAAAAPVQNSQVPPFFASSFGVVPPLAQSGGYGAGDPIVVPPETGPQVELAHARSVSLDALVDQDGPVDQAGPVDQDGPVFQASPVFHPGPMPLASQAGVAPQVPIAEVPVASLGLVQLIERLALAITVRQARHAEQNYRGVCAPTAAGDSAGPLLRAKPSRLGQVSETPDPDNSVPAFTQPAPAGDGAAAIHLHDPLARIDAAHNDWVDAPDDDLPPRFLGGHVDQHLAGSAPSDTAVPEAMVPASAESFPAESFPADSFPANSFPDDTFAAPQGVFGASKDAAAPVETRYSSLINMTMVRPDQAPPATRLPDSMEPPHGLEPGLVHQNDPVVQFPFPAGDNAAPAPMRAPTDQADRALRDALATLRRMSAQR